MIGPGDGPAHNRRGLGSSASQGVVCVWGGGGRPVWGQRALHAWTAMDEGCPPPPPKPMALGSTHRPPRRRKRAMDHT